MSSYYRGPYGGGGGVQLALPPFTPMVRRILWTLGGVFLVSWVLQLVAPEFHALVFGPLALNTSLRVFPSNPDSPHVALWQLVTYGLVHFEFWHLFVNGLGLWMFGGDVERVLGSRGFLRYVTVCVIGGGLAFLLAGLLTRPADAPGIVIGASAGVMGIVVAFAVFFPHRQVLFFGMFPMKAWVMAAIYAAFEVFGTIRPGQSLVSHTAHIGGLIAGYLYLKGFIKPGSWSNPLKRRRKPPFQVISGRRPGPYDIN